VPSAPGGTNLFNHQEISWQVSARMVLSGGTSEVVASVMHG
jgi:hypothetical protein